MDKNCDYFITSFEVEFELCNLRCKYCWLTLGDVDTVLNNGKIYTKQKGKSLKYDYSVEELTAKVGQILNKLNSVILKVSGGEIFLLPQLIEEIKSRANNYDKILFVSNGLKLSRKILERLDPNKFAFQISLDGHTPEANSLRFSTKTNHSEKIISIIELLNEMGFTVEISTVLTDTNIKYLPGFAKFIHEKFPSTIIYPFPVRFSEYFLSNNTENIKSIYEAWNSVPLGTLPPKGYMEQLINVIKTQKNSRCFLPLITASVCEDGLMPFCPCGMVAERGNIFQFNDIKPPQISDYNVNRVLKLEEPKCKSCFTHFDIMNLYIENLINYDEIIKCGIFKDRNLLDSLTKYKNSITKLLAIEK